MPYGNYHASCIIMYHVSTVRIPIYSISSETFVADQTVFESPR